MSVLRSWRESLCVFQKQHRTLFLFSLLLSIKRAYGALLLYCWPIFLAQGACLFVVPGRLCSFMSVDGWGPWALCVLVGLVSGMSAYLAARPSVEPKDFAYFMHHGLRHWRALILAPLGFALLFALDSPPSWAYVWLSFVRGVRMFVRVLPLYTLLGFIVTLFMSILPFVLFWGLLGWSVASFACAASTALIWPVWPAILTVLYVRERHKNPDVYQG